MDSFTPLDPPGRDAADYFRKLDVAALVIFCPAAAAPCQPAATVDVAGALKQTQKIWPPELEPPLLAQAWWVGGIRQAQNILNLSLGCDLRGVPFTRNRLAAPLDVVAAALTAAAGRLQITLTDYRVGLARARAAGAAIGAKLDEVQASGDLREFNLRYRSARLLAEKENRRFPTYSTARARLEAALAVCAASGAAVDFAKIFEEAT